MRRAKLDDCKFVYSLRNSKEGRNVSTDKGVIKYSDHKKWWLDHYKEYTIIDKKAYMRVEPSGMVSIFVRKKYRREGIADKLLSKVDLGSAIILKENGKSINLFTKHGFRFTAFYMEKK